MNEIVDQEIAMTCPQCGSREVAIQLFQEDAGTTTISRTKSKSKKGGHGLVWWLFIGWWWWIVDIFLWCFFFLPRLIVQIFKPKKKRGKSTTIEQTVNQVNYKTVCVCQKCGNNWVQSETRSNIANDAIKTSIKNLKKNVK